MDQLRSTLFDATAAVLFPGVVGSLEVFPFSNESLEIRSRRTLHARPPGRGFFFPSTVSFKRSVFLASFWFSLLHLVFFSRSPSPRPLEAWLPPPSSLSPPSARSAQLRWPPPTPTADSPAPSGVPTTSCMEVSHFVKSRTVSCPPARGLECSASRNSRRDGPS